MNGDNSRLLLDSFDRVLHPDTPTSAFAAWLRLFVTEFGDGDSLLSCDSILTVDRETNGQIFQS